jgi:hypothetical protein
VACVRLILGELKARFRLIQILWSKKSLVQYNFFDCEFTNYFSISLMEIGPSYL